MDNNHKISIIGLTILLVVCNGCNPILTSKEPTISPSSPSGAAQPVPSQGYKRPQSTVTFQPNATRSEPSTSAQTPPLLLFTTQTPTFSNQDVAQGLIAYADWTKGGGIETIQPDGNGRKRITPATPGFYFSPAWSRDGQWIAYSMANNITGLEYQDQIYIVRPDGSDWKKLTFGTNRRMYPIWSPNNRTIVFSEVRPNPFEITLSGLYAIDIDGSNYHSIYSTTAHSLFQNLAWSPNGKHIAFIEYNLDKKSSAIEIVDADGKNLSEIAVGQQGQLNWTPDSQQLYFTSFNCQINRIDIDGRHLQEFPISQGQLIQYITVSPDGLFLAFDLGTKDSSNCWFPQQGWNIGVMPIKNLEPIQIGNYTDWGGKDLSWSPVPGLRVGWTCVITELGDLLNLHAAPTLKSQIVKKLKAGENIMVILGPVQADHYYWWAIRSPDGTEGWVVDVLGWFQKL